MRELRIAAGALERDDRAIVDGNIARGAAETDRGPRRGDLDPLRERTLAVVRGDARRAAIVAADEQASAEDLACVVDEHRIREPREHAVEHGEVLGVEARERAGIAVDQRARQIQLFGVPAVE